MELDKLLKTLPPEERKRLEEKQQKMLEDAQRHIAIYNEEGEEGLQEALNPYSMQEAYLSALEKNRRHQESVRSRKGKMNG